MTIQIGTNDIQDEEELESIRYIEEELEDVWTDLKEKLTYKIHVLEERTLMVFRTDDTYFDLLKDFPEDIAGVSFVRSWELDERERITAIKEIPRLAYLKRLLEPRGDLNLDEFFKRAWKNPVGNSDPVDKSDVSPVAEEDNISTTSPGTAGSASGSTSTELAANNDHQEIPTAIPEDSEDSACYED